MRLLAISLPGGFNLLSVGFYCERGVRVLLVTIGGRAALVTWRPAHALPARQGGRCAW